MPAAAPWPSPGPPPAQVLGVPAGILLARAAAQPDPMSQVAMKATDCRVDRWKEKTWHYMASYCSGSPLWEDGKLDLLEMEELSNP